jgi:UrcA family protein
VDSGAGGYDCLGIARPRAAGAPQSLAGLGLTVAGAALIGLAQARRNAYLLGVDRSKAPQSAASAGKQRPGKTIMLDILSSSLAAILASGAVAAAPAPEAPVGHGQATVRLADLDLARPGDSARLERRLEKAALAACGAYDGSVRMMKMAVARSDCYRETLAEARGSLPVRALAQR